jgi:hypothetical protein
MVTQLTAARVATHITSQRLPTVAREVCAMEFSIAQDREPLSSMLAE